MTHRTACLQPAAMTNGEVVLVEVRQRRIHPGLHRDTRENLRKEK